MDTNGHQFPEKDATTDCMDNIRLCTIQPFAACFGGVGSYGGTGGYFGVRCSYADLLLPLKQGEKTGINQDWTALLDMLR